MRREVRSWVIVQMTDGSVKIWRDYGVSWGSPAYTVVAYRKALQVARAIRVSPA